MLIGNDSLIPLMESYGMGPVIQALAAQNASAEEAVTVLEFEMGKAGFPISGLQTSQVEHFVADMVLAGKIPGVEVGLGSNVEGVARAAAPSGMGVNAENVWANAPGPTYIFRFYVNGELKTTLTDYYITSLASIGAASGETVQICQVVDGVVGWWASKVVP